jgi:glycosyltransferase involved in cell wall biosynthesis
MTIPFAIVTPSYNQDKYIERTICSVLDQNYPALEYFVADGGSKDTTVQILRRYEERLSWVSERDRGQAHGVNKGILATKAPLIGWLNSDDVYYPGALQAAASFFERHPEVDVVYGRANHIDQQDAILEPYNTEPWNAEKLKDVCFLCQPAVFFRRSVVDRFGLLDESLKYAMDYEYWLRLAVGGATFAYLDDTLVAGSRMYPENKTLGSRVPVHVEFNSMTRRLLGRTPDSWLFSYAHAVLDTKGWRREDRVRFAIGVSAVSLSAAIRWNHRITGDMLSTTWRWVRGSLREVYKERVAR